MCGSVWDGAGGVRGGGAIASRSKLAARVDAWCGAGVVKIKRANGCVGTQSIDASRMRPRVLPRKDRGGRGDISMDVVIYTRPIYVVGVVPTWSHNTGNMMV